MKRMTTNSRSISHELKVLERLRTDPIFATEYLKAALKDPESVQALSIALRRIALVYPDVCAQTQLRLS